MPAIARCDNCRKEQPMQMDFHGDVARPRGWSYVWDDPPGGGVRTMLYACSEKCHQKLKSRTEETQYE